MQHRNRIRAGLVLFVLLLTGIFCLQHSKPLHRSSAQSCATETPAKVASTNAAAANLQLAAAPDVFAPFLKWAQAHADASQPMSEAELKSGVELATARKAALTHLIETDPKRALDIAVPEYLAKAMPREVSAQLEQHVSARGSLLVSVADTWDSRTAPVVERQAVIGDKTYKAFVYGKRLQQSSKLDIPMHGIALGNALAVHEDPVRILKPDEIAALSPTTQFANVNGACPVTGQSVSRRNVIDVGGRLYQTCCDVCPGTYSNTLSSQLGGPDPNSGSDVAGTVAASAWTTGQKRVLVIVADFTDQLGAPISSTDATNLINNTVSGFYAQESYGLTSMVATVTSPLHLPNTTAYYTTNYANAMSDGYTAASNAGYNPGSYDRYVVCTPHINGGIAGVGYVGAAGVALFGYFDLCAAAHELGHNYGCWHANYWNCTDGTVIGAGSNSEYGDPFSIMSFDDGNQTYAKHHDGYMKNQFGWLPNANVTTVSASGTFTIHAFDDPTLNSSNQYALKISDPTNSNYYWVELRQQWTGNKFLMNGADLLWTPWSNTAGNSNNGTQLLNCNPGNSAGVQASAIMIGKTFADTKNGIYITPTAKNGTTTGNQTLTVVVNIGTFSGNVPTASISANPSSPGVGSSVTLTANASDPAGDPLAYFWDFGDGTYSTDSQAIEAKSWGAVGTYTVKCTVSSMKGGVTTASTTVTVSTSQAPSITSQPQNATVPIGSTATFSVGASGTGTLSYQWKKNGNAISGATSSTYTTPSTTAADNGATFSVTVSNATGSTNSNPATLTVLVPTAAAAFVKTDTTTQGNWKGPYGNDGSALQADSTNYPAYATVNFSNASLFTWAASTSDVRAPMKFASNTDRIAACWYSGNGAGTAFSIDINLTDNQTHRIAFYALDWDSTTRAQTFEIDDAGTGIALDGPRALSNFNGGIYEVWDIKGHVTVKLSCTGGYNAVISGIFFGSGITSPPTITSPLTANGSLTNPFSYTITATNSPTSFNATGLPAGLSINTATGVISGTPTASGNFSVTLSATNYKGTGTATLNLSISNGLVLYWKLDETSGTSAADASGNSNTGTLTGGAWTSGEFGGGLSLNGSGQYALTSKSLSSQFAAGNLTVALWFKANAAGVVVDELGQASVNNGWHDSQIEVLSDGTVYGRVWSLPGVALGKITFGQWSHVALRYNSATQKVDGFLNGVQASGSSSGARQWPSSLYYALGATDSTNLGSGAYFNGVCDDFRVYNRVLSASEISALSVTNSPPVITSAATATPNPASVNTSVAFAVAANDSNGDALSYSWNFGDGATGTGATTSHTYTAVGTFTAVVTASDGHGNTVTSSVTVTVNSASSTDTVWVEDAIPAGGIAAADGGDTWTWVSANPAPYSGSVASQSNLTGSEHQHFFYGASATLTVNPGESLFAYVYLDPANPPSEIMLQWNNGNWEHRAYWGTNSIGWGSDGTASRINLGALPAAGQWVRLEVPASQVGLEGSVLNGMAFTLYGGRATWDHAGKTGSGGGAGTMEKVWIEDSIPAGGAAAADGGDAWKWTSASPAPYSGAVSSQSNIAAGEHQHYFYGATQTLSVNTGDALFAYVYLDPANTPSEIMLQWNNGNWEHRAYWGANSIGWGVDGTVSRQYMGTLPPAGQWVRLQVAASQVGLEGSTLNGMAFTLSGGRANWDHAGTVTSAGIASSVDGGAALPPDFNDLTAAQTDTSDTTSAPIDLGTVKVNQAFKLKLPLPSGLPQGTKFRGTVAGLPKGARVSGSYLSGKLKTAGSYTATITFKGKAIATGPSGKKGPVVIQVNQSYTLTVTP